MQTLPEVLDVAAWLSVTCADGRTHSWSGGTGFVPAAVADWVAAGARLVGGCCRVGPAEIAALARTVR